jgi:putative hydrolase of the HAD superfamily
VRYRAVLFDAGGTLLFLDYARIARGVSAASGVPLTARTLEEAAPAAALALEESAGSDGERAARFLRALCVGAGLPEGRWPEAQRALHALHRQEHLWSATQPGTPEALRRLRARGVRLGVVSNSDGRVESALREAGLLDLFEVVVDSSIAGVEKPDPRIFLAALEQLGVPAGEALYVGDVHEVDVVGARAAGMDAALVGADAEREGVRTARHVAALVDALIGPAEPDEVVETSNAGAPRRPDR